MSSSSSSDCEPIKLRCPKCGYDKFNGWHCGNCGYAIPEKASEAQSRFLTPEKAEEARKILFPDDAD